MTFLSVCSGIESASVAWNPLGWKAQAFAEIEHFPSAVLKHHYPETPNLGDMTKFQSWPDYAIDLLVGGTPCQSFSVAGLRKGLRDPRGNLTLVFLGLVERYQPRWIVWENVPGVLSDKTWAFGAFLAGLGELGYGFGYRILDAQYFGVAQRRRRVFVVGHIGGLWQRAAAVLFERESLCGNPAPRRETGKRVAPTISARTQGGGGLGTDFGCDGGVIQISGPCTYCGHPDHWRPDCPEIEKECRARAIAFSAKDSGADAAMEVAPTLRALNHDKSHANAGWNAAVAFNLRGREGGAMPEMDDVASIRAASGGSSRSYVAHALKGEGFDASEDGTGRGTPIWPVEIAPTLNAAFGDKQGLEDQHALNGAGHFVPGPAMAVRRLTATECERLQGFPDGYTAIPYRNKPAEECPDGPRYKALGNSMAVPVMRWIGQRIKMVDAI